ncbi:hypothetical protein G7Y89_g11570 [Cudoniella acicularis]|uniref:Cytochrome P450 n=1 Tax=Cudoniella acicularis TaxID=354080 RepID=A0A8H4RBQ8_9HELO|nr:hypothetical protein G7Y89_g11570 [Cudoniella acicularis]
MRYCHAKAFIWNSQALIEYGKIYVGNTGEPFALTVGGKTLYILTTPEHVAKLYKSNEDTSWDAMLNELLVGFGVKSSVIHKLWEPMPGETIRKGRPELPASKIPNYSLIHSTLDLYKRQLLPGPRFEKFCGTLLGHIDDHLKWSTLIGIDTTQSGRPQKVFSHRSLRDLCSTVLIGAISKTLFGDQIYEIEPYLSTYLADFNQDAWMLVFQYPGPKTKLGAARTKILSALENIIRGAGGPEANHAWIVRTVMEEQDAAGISEEDAAALLLMIYWAANLNPYRLGFWMLSYILFDKELHTALKTEIGRAYRDRKLDVAFLLTDCPKLDAVYQETLRLTSGALSARKIIRPLDIGGKLLEPPSTILISFAQLQQSKSAFGVDASTFDSRRFLKDKNLKNSLSFKPFGGGANYCPGRFVAKQEMFFFVATIITKFDISLSDGGQQNFPILDSITPSLGINGPQAGMDIFVDLKLAN